MGKDQNLSGKIFIFIEQYIFQLFFLFYGFKNVVEIIISKSQVVFVVRALWQGPVDHQVVLLASGLVFYFLLAVFNFVCAYGLHIRGKLIKQPTGFLEIFIPFISTYGPLLYNIIPFLHAKLNFYMIPARLMPATLLGGIIAACLGLVISSVAIFQLRKSFGIFVQVRPVVTQGLYKYVRHPIYCGQTITEVGFFFIIPRFYNLILGLLLIGIRFYRAVLEEKKLARYCPEYQAYRQQIPFILPVKFQRVSKNHDEK